MATSPEGPGPGQPYYIRMECVNFSAVLSDTEDLSTIRGSGLAMLHAVEYAAKALKELTRGAVEQVTTGASVGVFRVSAADQADAWTVARNLRARLTAHAPAAANDEESEPARPLPGAIDEAELLRVLDHLSILTAACAATADFRADMETLLALIRWQQQQAPSLVLPAAGTSWDKTKLICPNDHTRLADTYIFRRKDEGPGRYPASRSVRDRHAYGRHYKQTLYDRVIDGIPYLKDDGSKRRKRAYADELADPARQPDKALDGKMAALYADELADLARRLGAPLDGKMAVLYADGNRFSEQIRDLVKASDTPIETQKAIDKALQGWRSKLLEKVVKLIELDDRDYPLTRIETLLWGGDELIWVLPAWRGWEVAALFAEHIRNEPVEGKGRSMDVPEKDGWSMNMSHGLGMVFCHYDAPINGIRTLAKNLADKVAKAERTSTRLAVMVLESFDAVGQDLEAHLTRTYGTAGITPSAMCLTAPQGASWNDVPCAVAKMKEHLPRRRLHALADALLRHGPVTTETDRARGRFWRDLDAPAEAAIREAAETLGRCWGFDAQGTDARLWLHLDMLWDYLAPDVQDMAEV
ncbi:Cas10/Cmr2 second palm domain-containing protein [Tistrella mobilis]|uniref:Cas10/Cmr2 second palm domain-containing protein n=1 Tax=Tistrella mobilis TaxID=171437 RepID=UPI0011AE3763|nr:hypothetical protein [Tistrella mobilis]